MIYHVVRTEKTKMKNLCKRLGCKHLDTSGNASHMKVLNHRVYCDTPCPTYLNAYLCCYSCKRKTCKERDVKYHQIPINKIKNFLIFERFEQAP